MGTQSWISLVLCVLHHLKWLAWENSGRVGIINLLCFSAKSILLCYYAEPCKQGHLFPQPQGCTFFLTKALQGLCKTTESGKGFSSHGVFVFHQVASRSEFRRSANAHLRDHHRLAPAHTHWQISQPLSRLLLWTSSSSLLRQMSLHVPVAATPSPKKSWRELLC